jgi:hypothetical protein
MDGPSELFESVIRNAGSLVADCELCGRTHFATLEENTFDEGELAELRSKAKQHPDKYIEDPHYDSIAWGHIGGKQAVIGCPCNKLRELEDLIWSSRNLILEYLDRRTKARLEAAKEDRDLVKATKKVVDG